MPLRRAFFILFFAQAALAADSLLLDGTAATVGKVLVTIQDAYFYRALMRFRDREGAPLTRETGEVLRRTVQKVVFEEMVAAEIKSFNFKEGKREETLTWVKKAVKGRKARTQWKGILKHFGRTHEEAVDVLFRSLQVERFLQKKVETLTPVITPSEIQRYYNLNPGKFKGEDFERLRPSIERILKKKRVKRGLEEWVRYLKDKYRISSHLEG